IAPGRVAAEPPRVDPSRGDSRRSHHLALGATGRNQIEELGVRARALEGFGHRDDRRGGPTRAPAREEHPHRLRSLPRGWRTPRFRLTRSGARWYGLGANSAES